MANRRLARPLLLTLVGLAVGAMLGGGVTPGEAARAVKRALNADRVDGLSASRKPTPGKLLALDKDGRFPDSVVPRARGPRGTEGPAGAPGERGPSEAYVTRNNKGSEIPFGAPATINELRLPPGAYVLDFAAHAYLVVAVGTFVDCQLTANGQQLVKTAIRIGNVADATLESTLVMNEAATFTETTVVSASCSERVDTAAQLTDARLRAIRVGSVTVQP